MRRTLVRSHATGLRKIPERSVGAKAIELFRSRYDTADIAYFKGVHEATVVQWLHESREEERKLAMYGGVPIE